MKIFGVKGGDHQGSEVFLDQLWGEGIFHLRESMDRPAMTIPNNGTPEDLQGNRKILVLRDPTV